jgi:exopolysaccharide biosynthesis polyprenyl glycosylphosphotransferase
MDLDGVRTQGSEANFEVAFASSPERWTKRSLDVVVALASLVTLLPALLLIGLVIRLESPGSVIFRQDRVGLRGRVFRIWKFRTMYDDQLEPTCSQASRGDPRVTRFGRFLRHTSLDELPQLINVLAGDMSLIGPRPHAVEHDRYYSPLIPGYDLRHLVRPGITGWAQVNRCRGETETLDKMVRRLEHDLYYVRHGALWLDLKIMVLTIRVMKGPDVY